MAVFFGIFSQMMSEERTNESSKLLGSIPPVDSYASITTQTTITANEELKKLQNNENKKAKLLGIFLMILSGMAYSFLAVTVKWGSHLGFNASEMLFYRAFIQLIISLLIIFIPFIYKKCCAKYKPIMNNNAGLVIQSTGNNDSNGLVIQVNDCNESNDGNVNEGKGKHNTSVIITVIFVLLRGLFGACSTFLYFEATTIIPIGDCVSLKALAAVITAFSGYFVFREPLTYTHMVALIVSLLATVLIAQPPFIFTLFVDYGNIHNVGGDSISNGYYFAILSATAQSCIYLCIRKVKHINPSYLLISQACSCIFVALIIMYVCNTHWHGFQSIQDILCVIVICLVGYIAQLTLTKGAQLLIAGIASLFRCTDVFWSFIWQILLFGEIPNFLTLIGGAIMFLSVVLVTLQKIKTKKKKLIPTDSFVKTND